MTESAAIPASNDYELLRELDGSSWSVRENLVDILARELLGPDGGEQELLDVPPDARYLLGRIAPTKLRQSGSVPSVESEDADSTVDLGDDMAAMESSGVPLSTIDDDTAVDSDEDPGGDRDDEPVRRGLMIPASMGIRFQIPSDLKAFTVRASWGVYNPEKTGDVAPSGREIRRFRRTPLRADTRVVVADLELGTTREFMLHDDVTLRVDAYADAEWDRLLVEVALCNDRETPRRIPTNAWMFQTQLHVDAEGEAVFLPVQDVTVDDRWEPDDELRRLRLQYRDRLEFAIGRTCSVDWHQVEGMRCADRVWTTWLPTAETPQTSARDVPGALLDMRALANASAADVEAGLRPIVTAYDEWLAERDVQVSSLPVHLQGEARDAVTEARQVLSQLSDGLDFLVGDAEALRCFQFMNKVMADQRVHSQMAELRTKNPGLSVESAEAQALAGKTPHSWRVFQITFIVMQLRSLVEPATERRSGDLSKVELLFFPTGGGKTEAYLGLAAFAFAIRRRQGLLTTVDGPLDGRAGVTVLMRYTLRLLTSQQFQRATTLVCAAELARLENPEVWGVEPFRIGLWVGTSVSPKRVEEAAKELERLKGRNVPPGAGYRFSALQLGRCPWCGSPLSHADVKVDKTQARVFVRCPDQFGACPFSEGGQVPEGIPVLTTDEEIYRLVPAFVIATVDKFARMAREGQAASLFGYVSKRCERHGFVHPDYPDCTIKDGSKHPAKSDVPAASTHRVARLRPPDLIIQDELHLITGALGTTVGLFEVAIDAMTTWHDDEGLTIKPVIVASSATVRNAADQVRALYGREGVTVFPPQVIDSSDTFFSREAPVGPESPGRRYVGMSTTGVKLTTAEIQVTEALMAGAQLLFDGAGEAADPYMTLVGYFSAIRELAGMARYVQDDIQTALFKRRAGSRLPSRVGTDFGSLLLGELTSRRSSGEITQTLDDMAQSFVPSIDSTVARKDARLARAGGGKGPERSTSPFDVVLATSMLQVGVDVTRLGLMLMVGQPKLTAEYIQASSRVGRDSNRPGLVVTLGNWARPRDLAHYEQFRHFHETFYSQVEPLSVTPFSVTSLERGLEGVLVSAARVIQAAQAVGLSPEKGAGRVTIERPFLESLLDALVVRSRKASDDSSAEYARQRLINRLETWEKRQGELERMQLRLVYERATDPTKYGALIRSAESIRSRDGAASGAPFVVANSMREVQPEINLLVSPNPERLFYNEPEGAPDWAPQSNSEGDE